jgi:hypothetical protein
VKNKLFEGVKNQHERMHQPNIQIFNFGRSISIVGSYDRCSGASVFVIITRDFPDLASSFQKNTECILK